MRQNKSSSIYKIEVGHHTLLVMGILLVFTVALIFYLGMITGLAQRNANPINKLPPSIVGTSKVVVPESSTFAFNNALKGGKDSIEPLFTKRVASSQQTQQLLQQARQLLREPEPDIITASETSETVLNNDLPAISQTARDRLAQTAKPADDVRLYTLQVFSSPKLQSAQQLKTKLRSQGFNAYLEQSIIGEQKWHRVRVGKLPKKQAQSLALKLQQQKLQSQLLRVVQ